MGKQQELLPRQSKESDGKAKQEGISATEKKKIIKKFPFPIKGKLNSKANDDDSLKGWKPEKIVQLKQSNAVTKKSNTDISSQFLSFLPKAKVSTQIQPSFPQTKFNIFAQVKAQKPKSIKLTQEQLKWDGQDEFTLKKIPDQRQSQFAKEAENSKPLMVEQINGDEVVDKIKWLSSQKQNVIELDIAKQIDKNWEKQSKLLSLSQKDQINSNLKGRGQLTKLAESYRQKQRQLQAEASKKQLEKKKTKNVYGW